MVSENAQNDLSPNVFGVVFRFAGFAFDSKTRVLRYGGVTLPLQPKAADALALLLEAQGEVVTRERLTETLWPDGFVEQGNLHQTIYVLRRTLESTAPAHAPFIETVARRGYRFAIPVRSASPRLSEVNFRVWFAAATIVLAIAAALTLTHARHRAVPSSPYAVAQDLAVGHALVFQRNPVSIRKSFAYFQHFIAQHPDDPSGYAGMATAYTFLAVFCTPAELKTCYANAEGSAREALRRDPVSVEGLSNLGFILFERDDNVPEAKRLIRTALARDPRCAPAWESLGIVQLSSGEIGDAVDSIERAVALQPASAPYLRWLGIAHYYAGNIDIAARKLGASLDLAQSPITAYYLVLTSDLQRNANGTQRALDVLRYRGVDNAKLEAVEAFLAFHRDADRARRNLSAAKLARIAKTDVDARFLLAVVYSDLHRNDEARALLARQRESDLAFVDFHFLRLDPHFR